jgi:RND family efflux transporter MFP subunit
VAEEGVDVVGLEVDDGIRHLMEEDLRWYAESLDPSTRTMKTVIFIQNPEHLLLPGMYANIKLELAVHKDAITVPAVALLVEKGKNYVYIVKNDKANKREVVTGLDDGIYVEVLNGLVGDENIIISGHNGISDGEVVKISRKSKGE